MKRRIQQTLTPERAGSALLDFLSGRFTYQSRAEWGAHISAGRVRVNDATAPADRLLAAGDKVEFIAHDSPEPPVSFEVAIVFEDDHVLVVDKPPNLPCHPAGRYFNHTLWAWLKTWHGVETPALVNRLDRETSGLLLIAKTRQAEGSCRSQFEKRSVVKRYVALVEGEFPESLEAQGWLVPDPESGVHKRRRFVSSVPNPEPRTLNPEPFSPAEWAETAFRRLQFRNGVSEVEAVLRTGRLHQIRATLCSLGFPVVGDKLYGPDPMMFVRFCTDALTDDDRRRLRMDRQALHAMELKFQHPATGGMMHFEAPLPADMAKVLAPCPVKA